MDQPAISTLGEIVVDGNARPLIIDPAAERFEIRVGDVSAFLAFHLKGSVLSLVHTEVPPALRGKRLADALANSALAYARDRGLTVRPYCPFVAAYLQRHPEYQPLIDRDFRGR